MEMGNEREKEKVGISFICLHLASCWSPFFSLSFRGFPIKGRGRRANDCGVTMFYPADRVVEDSAQLWQDSTFPVALTALAELDVLAALTVWRVGKDEGLGGPSK